MLEEQRGTAVDLGALFKENDKPKPMPKLDGLAGLPTTDSGNGEAFAFLYGDSVRYDYRRKRFLRWNGTRWRPDTDGEIERLAKETARRRFAAAADIDDLKSRDAAARWAIGSESDFRRRAMLRAAASEHPIADSGENWDADDWLLGCENGVVDLRTGELRDGRPDDRLTMSTGVVFDPGARAERWENFLAEVFGCPELVDYVHCSVGYSLSGDTSEQVVFVGYGAGANGKSVFLGGLRSSMGDYSTNTAFSTLEYSDRPGGTNDVAALAGKRLVTASEVREAARLNEARVKALTGGDPVTARFLYGEYFTFKPKGKLWLAVNHRPKVSDDSYGFWRRIRLIPFTRTFGPDQADPRLSEILAVEADGILAWAVRGCLKWQEQGLRPPSIVMEATEAYRQESDPLANFLGERCVIEPNAQAEAAELYQAFKAQAEEDGEKKPMGANAFGRRLVDRGFEKSRQGGRGKTIYKGIGLLATQSTRTAQP